MSLNFVCSMVRQMATTVLAGYDYQTRLGFTTHGVEPSQAAISEALVIYMTCENLTPEKLDQVMALTKECMSS